MGRSMPHPHTGEALDYNDPTTIQIALATFSDAQLQAELDRRSRERVEAVWEARNCYGFGRDS